MIELSIVTPEGIQYKKEVYQADLPGEMGVFGVLYAHVNMVAALKAGRVDIIEQDGQGLSKSFFVSSGFAEVSPEKCVIIVEKADDLQAVDLSLVEARLKELDKPSADDESDIQEEREYLEALRNNTAKA